MIYRFKIVSEEVDNFFREIEIDSESDFLQLRNALLESVGYSKEGLSSFFLCDDDWSMREEIALEDLGSSSDVDVWIMSDTPLSELVEDEGQRLMFVFDFDNERAFYMELKEMITGKNLKDPICTRKGGRAPEQVMKKKVEEAPKPVKPVVVPVDDIDDDEEDKELPDDEFDMRLYGENSFNEDELPEGMDMEEF